MYNQADAYMTAFFRRWVPALAAWGMMLAMPFAAQAQSIADEMMTPVVSTPAIPQQEYPQPEIPEAQPQPAQDATVPDYGTRNQRVVILHGIGRTSSSMRKVARAFRHAGYDDMNIGYNSTRDVLAKIIEDTYRRIRHFSDDENEVTHFVCYSLGCLVTRGIIQQHRPKNLGRVVMLGPPNQGSEMADYLQDHAVSSWLFGPTLPQLGTGNRNMLEKLIGTEAADYELGIIAGRSTIDPVASVVLPDADDGRVPVSRTTLAGMKEHLVVDANHTSLIMNDAVIAKAVHFIQTGSFSHDTE